MKIIKINSCGDCPHKFLSSTVYKWLCMKIEGSVEYEVINKLIHKKCPLEDLNKCDNEYQYGLGDDSNVIY